MRHRTLLALVFLFTVPASAKDVYLPVAGSVGVFRTDARIFNPGSADIQVKAWFLPNGNVDNSSVQPVTITVPKRQMVTYNDVVTSLFQKSGLGGIRLQSDSDFQATQRVYATTSACTGAVNPCTLGQFLVGVESSGAKKSAVVIQLASGTFYRTNIGVMNPNATPATTTWRVYDKNNVVVGAPKAITIPPFGVLGPINMTTFGDNIPSTADLSDAWVGYVSDQPVVAYGSVVDNGSTDQTYVPAVDDTNPPTSPSSTGKIIDVTVKSFTITMTPSPNTLNVGDKVTFHVHVDDDGHGFTLVGPSAQTIIADRSSSSGFRKGDTFDQTFTIEQEGSYTYFCTHATCGAGHVSMTGTFSIGDPSDGPGGYYP